MHRIGCLLLVTLLSGCLGKDDFIRIGVLLGPLTYLIVPFMVSWARREYREVVPNAPLRPLLIALPFFALVAVDVVLWLGVLASSQNLSEFKGTLGNLAMLTTLLMWQGILGLTIVVWRLWFLLHAASSFEGACWLATGLYLGPGVLYSLGLFKKLLEPLIPLLLGCTLYSFFITPVLLLLFLLEANLRRRFRQPSPS